jgi:hypothetical protein
MNIFNGRFALRQLMIVAVTLLMFGCGGDNATTIPQVVVQPPTPVPVDALLQQLQQLPGITVEKRNSPAAGYSHYHLTLLQSSNHNDADSIQFTQRIRLLLKDINAPVVLQTLGYGMSSDERIALTEITQQLGANQIEVEHRYFMASRPVQVDWSTMTIEQAATDHHKIIELLKPILQGSWIASGRSKGGMTAAYLKRFYPQDLAGAVAYVAPLSLEMWDERFADYSLSIITPHCEAKYKAYQREALTRIDNLSAIVGNWALEHNYTANSNGYNVKNRVQAEIAMSWIYTDRYYQDDLCSAIPSITDTDDELIEFMYQSTGFGFIVDEGLASWLPYHMQAAAQLGNFAVPLSHIEDLLTFDVKDFAINLLGLPMPEFQPHVMLDIYDWSKNEATEMIFIYGQQDIFTGGVFPVETDATRDIQLYIEPGTHGINITDLSTNSQSQISATLQRWVQ